MMAFIEWKPNYNVGIEIIDEQHRTLVSTINRLYEFSADPRKAKMIEATFFTMDSYTKYHFRAEEDLMSRYRFPGFEKHRADHERLTAQLRQKKAAYEKQGVAIFKDFLLFLKSWFLEHTQGMDREYVQHLRTGISEEALRPAASTAPALRKRFDVVPLIEWCEQYDVGIDRIDTQHKDLAETINLVYTSFLNPGNKLIVEQAFKNLEKYTETHFREEEELMEKSLFPEKEKHFKEHKGFRLQVQQLRNSFTKYQSVVDYDLLVLLRNWFVEHIQSNDRQYIPYVKEKTQ